MLGKEAGDEPVKKKKARKNSCTSIKPNTSTRNGYQIRAQTFSDRKCSSFWNDEHKIIGQNLHWSISLILNLEQFSPTWFKIDVSRKYKTIKWCQNTYKELITYTNIPIIWWVTRCLMHLHMRWCELNFDKLQQRYKNSLSCSSNRL